jgi:hypothetical protein
VHTRARQCPWRVQLVIHNRRTRPGTPNSHSSAARSQPPVFSPLHANCAAETTQALPQTSIRKGVAGAGFQIALELGCLLFIGEGDIGDKAPRFENRRVR